MQESMNTFNKNLEEIKNKQMNNTIIEIKNTLEGINSRMSEAEEWISKLEGKMVEITSRGTNSPIQDKPKEKHAKAHTNQTNKD